MKLSFINYERLQCMLIEFVCEELDVPTVMTRFTDDIIDDNFELPANYNSTTTQYSHHDSTSKTTVSPKCSHYGGYNKYFRIDV